MEPYNFNEHELNIYGMGQHDALRFRADTHNVHQDVFKAETANHKIYVGYDDVEDGIYMLITFKNRYCEDPDFGMMPKKVEMHFRSSKAAIIRATRFLLRHPPPQPYCSVDY